MHSLSVLQKWSDRSNFQFSEFKYFSLKVLRSVQYLKPQMSKYKANVWTSLNLYDQNLKRGSCRVVVEQNFCKKKHPSVIRNTYIACIISDICNLQRKSNLYSIVSHQVLQSFSCDPRAPLQSSDIAFAKPATNYCNNHACRGHPLHCAQSSPTRYSLLNSCSEKASLRSSQESSKAVKIGS